MTTISSRYSKTYMFLPISPTPPSGMMRSGWSVVVWGIGVLGMGQKSVSCGVASSVAGVADGVGQRLARVRGRARVGLGLGRGGCRLDGAGDASRRALEARSVPGTAAMSA